MITPPVHIGTKNTTNIKLLKNDSEQKKSEQQIKPK